MHQTFLIRRMALAAIVSGLAAFTLQAQQAPRPTVDEDGTIHGALTVAPISSFLSPQAKAALTERLREPPGPSAKDGVEAMRKASDSRAKGALDGWLKIYPSNIEDTTIDGVHVFIVTPKAGVAAANRSRILINAHMGGFVTGGRYGGLEEAVPMAGRGKIKVIAVDYRMSPEYTFPAASEDMEAVYRYALKSSKPSAIGIYGCSAGGTLVAESMAWFQKKDLPRPGAISVMCSGAMKGFWFGGDSALVSPLLNASAPASGPPGVKPADAPRGYFEGINTDDPLITPGEYPRVLAQFPPTLVVSGTRDSTMSNAVVTYTELLKAGVEAQLFIQEGLGHGHFFAFPGTPESTDAYDLFWRFFDSHLTR